MLGVLPEAVPWTDARTGVQTPATGLEQELGALQGAAASRLHAQVLFPQTGRVTLFHYSWECVQQVTQIFLHFAHV